MYTVGIILYYLLSAFFLLLIVRLVMEYVFMFARRFEPKGLVAAALEVTYSTTDPPLKVLRRVLPPLRLGGVSLDLGFLVLVLLVVVLQNVVSSTLLDGR